MVDGYRGFDKALKYLFDNATEVSVERLYQSGTPIATITVDGQEITLYSPSSGGSTVTVSPLLQSGTPIANITVDGTTYAIYAPLGGGQLDGTTVPSSSLGNDGDEYFKLSGNMPNMHIVSFKFRITDRKGGGNDMNQFSRLGFYDASDNKYTFPEGTTWSDDVGHFEDDPISDNSKMLLVSTPGTVTVNLPSGSYIDSSVYTKFGWYTANDIPDRDPVGWELYVSEDGTNYTLIDTRTSQTITDTRETLAFKEPYVSAVLPTIDDIYYKKSGTWLKLTSFVTVEDLYNACVTKNVTPASHSLDDIVAEFLRT